MKYCIINPKVKWCVCVLFGPQQLVSMAIRLWVSSCCNSETGSVSWSTASPCHCPTSPTCPGWASLPRVGHGSRLCSFFFASWILEDLLSEFSHCRSAGTPCYVDSDGVVRMLNRSLGNTWTPLCNTRDTCKSKSDHYWVVGIHENPQQLRWLLVLLTCCFFFSKDFGGKGCKALKGSSEVEFKDITIHVALLLHELRNNGQSSSFSLKDLCLLVDAFILKAKSARSSSYLKVQWFPI